MAQGFTKPSDVVFADSDAIHDNAAAEISAIASKGTPINADFLLIEDSAAGDAKKKITIGDLPGGGGTDSDAIHDNVDGEIALITEKVSPVGADLIIIEDSAASNAKKRVQVTNLPGGADADAIHDNVASEISAITAKGTPIDADFLLIEDSADSNAKKRITVGDLPGGGGSWGSWIAVAGGIGFQNSWVNFGSGFNAAEYRIHTDGMVQLRGLIKSGTSGTAAFTLPTGFRPILNLMFAQTDGASLGKRLDVQDNGDVIPSAAMSNGFVSTNLLFDSTGGS